MKHHLGLVKFCDAQEHKKSDCLSKTIGLKINLFTKSYLSVRTTTTAPVVVLGVPPEEQAVGPNA